MSDQPQIEAPRSRTGLVVGIVAVIVVVIAAVVFFVTRGNADDDKLTKVTLGTVGASDPYWKTFKTKAKAEGIDLTVKDFADYAQPNPALDEGALDINQFQHLVYLADYNVKNDKKLTPIGATAIYPLGLFSTKVDSVEDIKQGDTVVVPDDDSNQARGLLILQSAGLVKLKDGGTIFSKLSDIDTGASKVKVKAIKADLTPTSLPDVAAAIINNDFVEKAGLKFSDAIATDDPKDKNALPYVNVFAVRPEDKDNPTFKKLVTIYQDDKQITDGVQEVSGNTAILLKTPVADLVASLAEVEKQTRDNQ